MSDSELPDWDGIVDRHAKRVFGVAMRILGSVHDAEDVAQDVFAEAFQLHKSGPVQNWTGLLVRLATLRSLDRLRRNRPTVEVCESDRITTVQPFQEAMATELTAWLRSAIRRLPDQQAAVFVMFHFEHLHRDGIATNLGISPDAVSTALYKARQHLTKELAVFNLRRSEMNRDNHAPEFEQPLDDAVRAVLASPLPEEAIERVKSRAKSRANYAAAMPARSNTRDRWHLIKWICLTGGAAAVLALLVLLFPRNSAMAWTEMLQAVRARPWVHGTTTWSDGTQSQTSEFWVSTEHRTAAFKFGELIQFDDFAKEVTLKYDAKDNAVYSLPVLKVNEANVGNVQTPAFLERLLDEKADTRNMFHGERVVRGLRQDVEEDSHKMVEYLVHLEHIGNSSMQRTLRIRLDAATQLPRLWEERHASGLTAITRFDFPDSGPSDIYALGVPRTAQRIDRIPRGDLARIAKVHKADRQRFDDYDAVVVQNAEGVPTSLVDEPMNLNINRVRRSGSRYRIDQLIMAKPGLTAPSENADRHAWWRENREHFWTVPMLICDGKQSYHYRMLDGRIAPGKEPNLAVTKLMEIPVGLPVDDRPVEWPHLMPEFSSRPNLAMSDKDRSFQMEANPDDGPVGSVRLVISGRKGEWTGVLYRYWFDPERDDVLRKSISTVFQQKADDVAYLDNVSLDDFARSPSGKWFPQTVRRSTNDPENPGWIGVTRFYVDFDVKLPDALYQPLQD